MPLRASLPAPAQDSGTAWRGVAAVLLCGTAVAMNLGKVPIAMPELRSEFGLTLVSAGYLSSMVNTLALTCALLFGVLAGRVDALRLCAAGLLVSALGTAAALCAPSETVLLASRLAEGAGLVSVAVSGPTLLTAATAAADRRFVLSMWSAYVPAGVGLAMLVAPLTAQLGGWRGLWSLTAMMLAAALLAVGSCRHLYRPARPLAPAPPADAAARPPGARQALASAAPWLLGGAMGTWSLQHFALIVWLPTFLRDQRGLAPAATALLCCLMVLVNVPGNLLGGRLLQRGHGRGALIAAASLGAGLAGAGIYLEGLPDGMRYLLCLVLSFVGGIIPACVFSSSARLARSPVQIATLQGLYMQCSNLGSFAGPPLIAWLVADSGQWQIGYMATGSAAACGILLGIVLRKYPV